MGNTIKTKSVELPYWLILAVKEMGENISEIIRDAIGDFIERDKHSRNIVGKKIICVSLREAEVNYMKTQKKNKRFCSVSEFIRNALINYLRVFQISPSVLSIPDDCVAVPVEKNHVRIYNIIRRLE